MDLVIPPILIYALAVFRRANMSVARRAASVFNKPAEQWRSALYALEDELRDAGLDEDDDYVGDDTRCVQIIGEIVSNINEHDENLNRILELGTEHSDVLLNANYHYDAPEAKIGDAVVRDGVWWVYGVYDFLDDEQPDDGGDEPCDDLHSKAAAQLWSSLFTAWLKGGMDGALALMREVQPVCRQARSALVMFATWERAAEAPSYSRQWAEHATQRVAAMLSDSTLRPERL